MTKEYLQQTRPNTQRAIRIFGFDPTDDEEVTDVMGTLDLVGECKLKMVFQILNDKARITSEANRLILVEVCCVLTQWWMRVFLENATRTTRAALAELEIDVTSEAQLADFVESLDLEHEVERSAVRGRSFFSSPSPLTPPARPSGYGYTTGANYRSRCSSQVRGRGRQALIRVGGTGEGPALDGG